MTLYTQQSSNTRKTWALMGLFLAFIIFLCWFLSYFYNSPAILYFGVIFSLTMNVFSYWYSDKIVLAMNGARPATHGDSEELFHIVENLSITAGLPMPKIFIIDDLAPNAFATGRDKNHAVVAVTSGLLKILDKTELEGVIAHELSHIGNRDILLATIIAVLVGFVSIIADYFLRFGGLGRNRDREGGQIGAIIMIVGIIFTILSPIIATLIQLAVSRKREFLADASGALLTRYPEGLANALRKISAYSLPMQKANNATAHLFISNPFGKKGMSGLAKLFMTHPPVEERVGALLNSYAKQ
jgi:heat shock protein HtpX